VLRALGPAHRCAEGHRARPSVRLSRCYPQLIPVTAVRIVVWIAIAVIIVAAVSIKPSTKATAIETTVVETAMAETTVVETAVAHREPAASETTTAKSVASVTAAAKAVSSATKTTAMLSAEALAIWEFPQSAFLSSVAGAFFGNTVLSIC
jgi:hypothetical protein